MRIESTAAVILTSIFLLSCKLEKKSPLEEKAAGEDSQGGAGSPPDALSGPADLLKNTPPGLSKETEFISLRNSPVRLLPWSSESMTHKERRKNEYDDIGSHSDVCRRREAILSSGQVVVVAGKVSPISAIYACMDDGDPAGLRHVRVVFSGNQFDDILAPSEWKSEYQPDLNPSAIWSAVPPFRFQCQREFYLMLFKSGEDIGVVLSAKKYSAEAWGHELQVFYSQKLEKTGQATKSCTGECKLPDGSVLTLAQPGKPEVLRRSTPLGSTELRPVRFELP